MKINIQTDLSGFSMDDLRKGSRQVQALEILAENTRNEVAKKRAEKWQATLTAAIERRGRK